MLLVVLLGFVIVQECFVLMYLCIRDGYTSTAAWLTAAVGLAEAVIGAGLSGYLSLCKKDHAEGGIIDRQLVETRQGTKMITQVLEQAMPDTEIVYVKAGLVSDFRQEFSLYKVRELNDTHHAKDAYLNIVVGNTYHTKFTKDPLHYLKEAAEKPKDEQSRYHMDKIFKYDVARGGEQAWTAGEAGTIRTVKRVMARNSVLISHRPNEAHGALSNKATIWGKAVARPGAYLPVKSSDLKAQDVTKYGGITAIANSGYTLVEYKENSKTIRSLEALPIFLGRAEQLTERAIAEYVAKALQTESPKKGIEDLQVRKRFLPLGSKVKVDGFYYYLGGKTGDNIYLKNAVPFYLNPGDEEYLREILKAIEKSYYSRRDKNSQPILTEEKNIQLYRVILDKLGRKPYANNRWNLYTSLIKGREREKELLFSKLSLPEQCEVIQQMIIWINTARQNVDLRLIGGATKSGTQVLNKKISKLEEFVLISQSVTGIYETRSDLLTL